jgi:hypothetical protein
VNKTLFAALMLTVTAAPALAAESVSSPTAPTSAVVATRGKMLLASDGARLAPVYRVGSDGAQIILDGRMVTVPTSTIALTDGKLTTSLTKGQVIALP